MRGPYLILVLVCFIMINCSKGDEGQDILKNVEGTVIGTVSCNTEGQGLAYEIAPDNFEISSGSIITATLPEGMKQNGLKIKFDMRQSKKNITICTANFIPEQFYEIFNIATIND